MRIWQDLLLNLAALMVALAMVLMTLLILEGVKEVLWRLI